MTAREQADLLYGLDGLQHRLDSIAGDLAALRERINGGALQ